MAVLRRRDLKVSRATDGHKWGDSGVMAAECGARIPVFAGASLACWIGVIAAGRVITAFLPPSWFWCAWCG